MATFDDKMEKLIESLGAFKTPIPHSITVWRMKTKGGPVEIWPKNRVLFMRFDNPMGAARVIYGVNHHSGKWNFYFSDSDKFEDIEAKVRSILTNLWEIPGEKPTEAPEPRIIRSWEEMLQLVREGRTS